MILAARRSMQQQHAMQNGFQPAPLSPGQPGQHYVMVSTSAVSSPLNNGMPLSPQPVTSIPMFSPSHFYPNMQITLPPNARVPPILSQKRQPPMTSANTGYAGTCNHDAAIDMRKLFIGALAMDVTEEHLKAFYEKFGEVVDCIVIRDPVTKESRKFGFVTFAKAAECDAALENVETHIILGKRVDCKRSVPREYMDERGEIINFVHRPSPYDRQKIYVKGMVRDATKTDREVIDEMRRAFRQFGNVQQVEFSLDPRRLPIVLLDNEAAVQRAIIHTNIQPLIICGRQVQLIKAIDMDAWQQAQRQKLSNEHSPRKSSATTPTTPVKSLTEHAGDAEPKNDEKSLQPAKQDDVKDES